MDPLLHTATSEAESRRLSAAHPNQLIWGRNSGGRRAYLDGEPLTTGAGVEALIGDTWIAGRLEVIWVRDLDDQIPVLWLGGHPVGTPERSLPVRRL